jgi:non-heme chloroperoxidase
MHPPANAAPRERPLLFIHGAFVGAWMWTDTFLPWFARRGYVSHALSLREHGGSEGGEQLDLFSIADYVEDVETTVAWMKERGWPAPALIGHSMGGFVIQKYLERNRAPAAALLCSVPPQGLLLSQINLFVNKPDLLVDIRKALFAQPVDDAILERFRHNMQLESQRAIRDMSIFNPPILPAERRPPLIIIGARKDLIMPTFLISTTARNYSQKAYIFPDMGHAVTHERDWQKVATLVEEWLRNG